MKKMYEALSQFCVVIVAPLSNLGARIYIGMIFWRSGVAKLDDMEETIESFDPAEDGDFALNLFTPEVEAYLAVGGEIVLPILLILGLFTRIGAAGLFVMAAVIQYFVFQLEIHYFWMIILAMLIGQGGSKISLDNFLLKLKNP